MRTNSSNIGQVSIVIVDDDDVTLECYARLLRGMNCSLQSFTNPVESLAVLLRQLPQLLLVDMNMPCMDGMELVTELFAVSKLENCRTHLCSSAMPPSDIRRLVLDMGIDAVSKDMVMDKAWLRNAIQRC
ncbi:MAG: response regulator [Granulosicoccus sp.]